MKAAAAAISAAIQAAKVLQWAFDRRQRVVVDWQRASAWMGSVP